MTKQSNESKQLLNDIPSILEKKDSRIFACQESLLLFSLVYFSKYHHYAIPDFHLDMYKDLSYKDRIIGLIWIAFRESAKTSLAKIKVIHNIVYGKKKFQIWTSFDQKKAEGNLFDIALELQTNENLIADFGQLFYEDAINERKSTKKSIGEFITKNGCKVKAYSTGQSTRGEVFGEYRPDFAVLDDIETSKTIVSEARTEQVISFIDEMLSGLSGDMNILVLGNRLIDNGSIAYLENRVRENEHWTVRDIKAIENGKVTWQDKYALTSEEADLRNQDIHNPKEHVVSLEAKKLLLGETVFNREMLNTPLSDESREFKIEWLRKYFTTEDIDGELVNRYITIDVADSKDREARKARGQHDYTGITVVDWDIQNNWYVQYAKRRQLNGPELIDAIFWLWETFKPIKIGVEKKAFEDQIQPYIRIKSDETGIYPSVVELKHGGNRKEDRIRGALQGRAEAGKIHFLKDATDNTDELRMELHNFPFSDYDDLSDALAYIEQIGVRPIAKDDGKKLLTTYEEIMLDRHNQRRNSIQKAIRNL